MHIAQLMQGNILFQLIEERYKSKKKIEHPNNMKIREFIHDKIRNLNTFELKIISLYRSRPNETSAE